MCVFSGGGMGGFCRGVGWWCMCVYACLHLDVCLVLAVDVCA